MYLPDNYYCCCLNHSVTVFCTLFHSVSWIFKWSVHSILVLIMPNLYSTEKLASFLNSLLFLYKQMMRIKIRVKEKFKISYATSVISWNCLTCIISLLKQLKSLCLCNFTQCPVCNILMERSIPQTGLSPFFPNRLPMNNKTGTLRINCKFLLRKNLKDKNIPILRNIIRNGTYFFKQNIQLIYCMQGALFYLKKSHFIPKK